MPASSRRQLRWLWANRPDIARRWTEEAKAAGQPVVQPKRGPRRSQPKRQRRFR